LACRSYLQAAGIFFTQAQDETMFPVRRILSVIILSALAGSAGSGLPGNATSLTETYGDWTVICAAPQDAAQVNRQNGQRVLAIELAAIEGGNAASGTLVLPFGLNLDQGVALSVDVSEILPPLRFSTCLPAGCLVN